MKYFNIIILSICTFTFVSLPQSKLDSYNPIKSIGIEKNEQHEKIGYNPELLTNEMKYFSPQDLYDGNLVTVSTTLASNNDLLVFWVKLDNSLTYYNIYLSRSSNNGADWYSTSLLKTIEYSAGNYFYITSTLTSSNRIMLIYNQHTYNSVGNFYKIFSDNNGITWSTPQLVLTGFGATGRNPYLSKTSNGDLWLIYNRSDVSLRIRKSTDNGDSWSSEKTFSSSVSIYSGTLVSLDIQKIGIIYGSSEAAGYNINLRTSSDDGATWTSPNILVESTTELSNVKAVKNSIGNIYVTFQQEIKRVFKLPNKLVNAPQSYGHVQSDVLFIKSTDNGNTWSPSNHFTNYYGYDGNCNISLMNNQPIIFFQSVRGYTNNRLWYGMLEITKDSIFPPSVPVLGHVKPEYNSPVIINCLILNNIGIQSAVLTIFVNGISLGQVNLYNDGMHNDGLANDNYWGNVIGPFDPLTEIYYSLFVTDSIGNQITRGGTTFNLADYLNQAYVLNMNKIEIPIVNNGVTANSVGLLPESGAKFEEGRFLFSGGFLISGYSNDTLWVNGAASSSRIEDYLPGPQGSIPDPTNTKLYVVKESDAPFSQSWQDWINAVNLGADFYDGNGDSIYLPIDLNANGQWDFNEDRPGLVGDETIFCVYNDRVPSNLRRFGNVKPRGLEIKQTVYAFHTTEYSLDHSIFIKYQMVNNGQFDMDSVYFSGFADADIGQNYESDLFGSDTLSSSGFIYKKLSDAVYGSNPPAFYLTMLKGPTVFIPGETFIDNNANGIYDTGIDISIDTAFNVRGGYLGIDTIPGAKNLSISSSMHYMSSHPTMGDPNDVVQARNLQLGGLTTLGLSIDPCNWSFGNVFGGVNCLSLNPKFLYSGNPETNFGWINSTEIDQRALINVGPFSLKKNKSMDLVVAYVVGRGNSGVNSVTIGREKTQAVIEAFKNNFPVLVKINSDEIKNEFYFKLFQNYPNPFNPFTRIHYQVSSNSYVTLKVYDILGREVITLVDEYKPVGSYEVEFSAKDGLPSGVYIYTLKAGDHFTSRKMLLLK